MTETADRIESIEIKIAYLEQTIADLGAMVLAYGQRTERLEDVMKLMRSKMAEFGADKEPSMPAGVRPPHY